MVNKDFYTAVEKRRSIYTISKQSPISDGKIQEIIEHAVNHAPSAFNMQSTRVVLLLGVQHDKLWDITTETLRKIVPEAAFSDTKEKMDMFKSGYGSVLFFNDEAIVQHLQKEYSTYAENFPIYADQSTGMLQYIVWTALELEGFGATLQHYNPLIDADVKKEWGIPDSWKLTAQMPFGIPTAPAGEKTFSPIEERVIVKK